MSEEFNQEYVFVWRIQNFANSFHKNGEEMDSPVFNMDSSKKSQWFLKIYPRGYKKEHKEFISIYLYNKNPAEYDLDCELEMIGAGGSILNTLKFRKDAFPANSFWGFPTFARIKYISDKLENGLLTIRCRTFFNSQQNKPECEANTEIGVDRQSLIWNVKIKDVSSKVIKKKLQFPNDSAFEVTLNKHEDALKIDISPKKDPSKPKSVTFKMSLVDAKGKELISKSGDHLFEAKETWEFPDFITKTFLDVNKSAFVEKDSICLLCNCAISNGTVTNTVLGTSSDFDECSTLQIQLKNMLLDKTYSDVTLKAGNEVVQAHKCVLAARSPVFSAMFQQDMIESKTNTVDIHDVEANTLKSFLYFIYTATLENIDYDTAKKLLLVAEKYQVLTLKEKCVSFLESILQLGNVFEILSLADLIGHERLKCAAVNIIVSSSEIVLNLPDWSTLIQNNTKLATEIISKIVCSKNNTS